MHGWDGRRAYGTGGLKRGSSAYERARFLIMNEFNDCFTAISKGLMRQCIAGIERADCQGDMKV